MQTISDLLEQLVRSLLDLYQPCNKMTTACSRLVNNWEQTVRLGSDVVSVCRQPIKLLFSLFARTNSPSGNQALTKARIKIVKFN